MSRVLDAAGYAGVGCRQIIWRGLWSTLSPRSALGDFYAAYLADGHGRTAYEPSVMVALIL